MSDFDTPTMCEPSPESSDNFEQLAVLVRPKTPSKTLSSTRSLPPTSTHTGTSPTIPPTATATFTRSISISHSTPLTQSADVSESSSPVATQSSKLSLTQTLEVTETPSVTESIELDSTLTAPLTVTLVVPPTPAPTFAVAGRPDEKTTAAVAGAGAGAVVVLALANPAAANKAATTARFLEQLDRCIIDPFGQDDGAPEVDWMSFILPVPLGPGGDWSRITGAMLFTTLFYISSLIACYIIAQLSHQVFYPRKISGIVFSFCVTYFGPNVVAVSIPSIADGPSPAREISAIALLITAGVLCFLFKYFATLSDRTTTRVCGYFQDREENGPTSEEGFAYSLVPLIDSARPPCTQLFIRLHVLEDVMVAVLLSFISGLMEAKAISCETASVLNLLFSFLHLAYLIVVRPYGALVEQFFASVIGLVQVTETGALVVAIFVLPLRVRAILVMLYTSMALTFVFFAELGVRGLLYAARKLFLQRNRAAQRKLEQQSKQSKANPLFRLTQNVHSNPTFGVNNSETPSGVRDRGEQQKPLLASPQTQVVHMPPSATSPVRKSRKRVDQSSHVLDKLVLLRGDDHADHSIEVEVDSPAHNPLAQRDNNIVLFPELARFSPNYVRVQIPEQENRRKRSETNAPPRSAPEATIAPESNHGFVENWDSNNDPLPKASSVIHGEHQDVDRPSSPSVEDDPTEGLFSCQEEQDEYDAYLVRRMGTHRVTVSRFTEEDDDL